MNARALSAVVIPLLAALLPAQERAAVLRVEDVRGISIPYALVATAGGRDRVADQSGHVRVLVSGDSVQLTVRRIGYREHVGWMRASTDTTIVRLTPIARTLDSTIVAARSTPLSRTGFYDRVSEVQRGAVVGEFITPEELETRGGAQISDLFRGRRYVSVSKVGTKGRSALLGRGGCGVTILLDGVRMSRTVEGAIGATGTSIMGSGKDPGARIDDGMTLSIDELVATNHVMAIEIYPSSANAPASLQQLTGRGSCGIVALWTGPRG